MENELSIPDIAMLYLGAFAPDNPEFQSEARSRAGDLFQRNFLAAIRPIAGRGLEVYSYIPVPSFPKLRRLVVRSQKFNLASGELVRTLPHFNLGLFKIATLGVAAAFRAFGWAVRNRRAPHRIVVAYNLNAPPAAPIALVCRLMRMKFVPFVGDLYVPGEVVRDTLLRKLEFALQTRSIPKADGLLVANMAIAEDFAPGRRALLLEGGVVDSLLGDFTPGTRSRLQPFHIVFAGQLSRLNGIDLLIDALEILQGVDIRVTVLGRGDAANRVAEAARRDPRIEYRGLVPHECVLEAYRQADLLVNLRRTNCRTQRYVFPSKLVECLATGVPVLSTGTGHCRSEFGGLLLLLEDESPTGLAAKLQEILSMNPSELWYIGERAREHVCRCKSWEAQAQKLRQYLETEVLERVA